MKRYFIFAAITLLAVACKSTPEKAVEKYEDIVEAVESGNKKEVKEAVEDMTVWYEDLSEEDKELVDRELIKHVNKKR